MLRLDSDFIHVLISDAGSFSPLRKKGLPSQNDSDHNGYMFSSVPAADIPAGTPDDVAMMQNSNGATAQSPAHLQCLDYLGLDDTCGFDISGLPTLHNWRNVLALGEAASRENSAKLLGP